MSEGEAVGYAKDIKPLFREEDQVAMDFMFDLWDWNDVRENAQSILDEVEAGAMPCDAPWEKDKVELFRNWMRSGMAE